MSSIEPLLLSSVESSSIQNTLEFASTNSLDHEVVVGGVKALLVDAMLTSSKKSRKSVELTDEGKGVVESGSQEAVVFAHVKANPGCTRADLEGALGKEVRRRERDCTNTCRGNHTAYSNCTLCERQAFRRAATQYLYICRSLSVPLSCLHLTLFTNRLLRWVWEIA